MRAIAFTATYRSKTYLPNKRLSTSFLRGSNTMGNCFGKPSDKNFSGEGRAVGATAAAPAQKTSKIPQTQGGRTLGASSQADGSGSSPRDAAAKAAEVRTYRYTTEPGYSKPRKHAPKKMVATAWM
jgi:hypothetical protein